MFFWPRKKDALSITALGGIDRVGGANCYLLEAPNLRILVDCGYGLVPLPGSLLADNLMRFSYPDFSRIGEKKIDIVLLTHPHLDHFGALPRLIEEQQDWEPKIVASELTLRMARRLFYDTFQQFPFKILKAEPEKLIECGECSILPIEVPHSVPQAMGFYLEIAGRKIFYTGDFKVNDVTDQRTDAFKRAISCLAQKEIDFLFLDSSNVYEEGFTPSDRVVWQELSRIFDETEGRIIFATFSSHLERLRAVIQIAQSQGRPVYAAGMNLAAFLAAGEVKGWKWLNYYSWVRPEPNALILTTGCQAESGSGLVNAVFGEASFQLSSQDTVIIAADPIPIPEIESRVGEMVERLVKATKRVYISKEAPGDFSPEAKRANIHVSGHEKQDGLLYMAREMHPKIAVPIHGDVQRREYLVDLLRKEGIGSKIIAENIPFMA